MVYICADDYGLCHSASLHIQECVDRGALNKVSVFANFDQVDLQKLLENKNLRVALHLNLVEGMCMADAGEIDLLADKDGRLKRSFIGLLWLSLLRRKQFSRQVYKEIKAQVSYWKGVLPPDVPFCMDSHQHTHLIPGVFHALLKVLQEEGIRLQHMRIPAEPVLPYIMTPSLYLTYGAVNIIKQWLLKFLWLFDRKAAKKHAIPTSYFLGILFSGNMDAERVCKILPKYIKLAEKDGRDVEVLLHPGYLGERDPDFEKKNVVFESFYLSEKRKTEFDSAMTIQKEVCSHAFY